MALTRQMLKAMGIEEEKVDQIIESHAESIEGLKKEAERNREQAQRVPDLEKKIEELSSAPNDSEEWKAKYDEERERFEAFKAQVESDKALAEKQGLFKSLLREVGIDDKRIDAILKVTDLGSVEVADGALSEREALAEKVKAEWAEFIPQKREEGAQVDNPPAASVDDFDGMSLAEKMQYANANPGDPKVKAWLAK